MQLTEAFTGSVHTQSLPAHTSNYRYSVFKVNVKYVDLYDFYLNTFSLFEGYLKLASHIYK